MSMIFEMTDVETKIGYSFKDKCLLRRAFTHSTYSNENKADNNESLEFLGDSVLNFIVTSYIFKRYPDLNEGQYTRLRASIVSAMPLSETVKALKLNEYMLLGAGEQKTKDLSHNIYCDLYEAVVGAIYLDGGFDFARKFVIKTLDGFLNKNISLTDNVDYKTKLSEFTQKNLKNTVKYQTAAKTGPSHNPDFTVNITLDGKILCSGTGNNKKSAEQDAAKNAFNILSKTQII